jgi:hypothetical protein
MPESFISDITRLTAVTRHSLTFLSVKGRQFSSLLFLTFLPCDIGYNRRQPDLQIQTETDSRQSLDVSR